MFNLCINILNQPNRNIVVHGELPNQAPEQDYIISIFPRLFMILDMYQTLFWNRGRVEYVNGYQRPIQFIRINRVIIVTHLNPRFEYLIKISSLIFRVFILGVCIFIFCMTHL